MACTLLCLWSISGEKCTERFRSGLQKMQEYIGNFGQRWYCLCPSSSHPGWTVERKDVCIFQEADESFRKEIIKVNKNEISDRAVNLAGTIKTAPDIKSLSRSWIWLESSSGGKELLSPKKFWERIRCEWDTISLRTLWSGRCRQPDYLWSSYEFRKNVCSSGSL